MQIGYARVSTIEQSLDLQIDALTKVRAVAVLRTRGQVVAPVDVLISLGMLTPASLEDWRRGRLPCLEHAISGSLSRLSRLLRILRFHAH